VKLSRILSKTKRNSAAHWLTHVPGHLSAQFRQISDSELGAIQASLEQHYFAASPLPLRDYLATEWGQQELQDHLVLRLRRDREEVIPWLDDNRSLRGSKVLEIGCGTGCSTVALAEQGAEVIGIDVDESALEVAKRRCEIYGLDVEFRLANAVKVGELFRDTRFDFIIFFASLEHMYHKERISAIRATWDMLPSGGLWCIVETPNRLWHTDSHTSRLPFFHWLPDELAFYYSRFSQRPHFREKYDNYDDEQQRLDFLRQGRGLSFHEFALAIGSIEKLNVRSSLATHLAGRAQEAWLRQHPWMRKKPAWLRRPSWLRRMAPTPPLDYRYQALLAELYPSIHPGFFDPYLDLILLKIE
jgi:S-adenosylmethionine-dependent methyltransferase